METMETNQVSVINKSLDLIKTGPEILIANQNRKDKALIVGRNILSVINDKGMDAATDDRAKNYLINIKTAADEIKDSRTGVTQIMDQLKKMYTEVESELDIKNYKTIPGQIQTFRNSYAAHVAAETERKRKEAERVAAKAKEAVEIKFQMETNYTNQFHNYLLERKQKMQNGFNAITLDNFEERSAALKGLVLNCNFKQAGPFAPVVLYHNQEELKSFADAVIIDKEPDLTNNFMAEMNLLKDELIDKLPSKLSELQEEKRLADEAAAEKERSRLAEEKRQQELKATKDKAENKRLEEQAELQRKQEHDRQEALKKQQEQVELDKKKRELEEEQKMQQSAEESKRKSSLESEVKKQGEQTMVLFEQEAAIAEAGPAPEARQGYEIKVLHPVGYTQIFAFWMDGEGKNLPVDKIGRTSCDQMRAWAEKKAQKDGTKIESKFLSYEETFKAVNRKAK